MRLLDKRNVLPSADGTSHIELELGCGDAKRHRNAIGVDMLDYPDVDIVGDVYDVLSTLRARSVDAVYSYHFVEHVADVPKLLAELARVIKLGGHLEFVAPHFSNPYFYSDPTHRRTFGLYTFCYFADKSPFARKVPTYGSRIDFEIVNVELIFKSARPFVFRYGIKRILGAIFNSCTYLRELYEENFCYLFPCYEVRYILKRVRTPT